MPTLPRVCGYVSVLQIREQMRERECVCFDKERERCVRGREGGERLPLGDEVYMKEEMKHE